MGTVLSLQERWMKCTERALPTWSFKILCWILFSTLLSTSTLSCRWYWILFWWQLIYLWIDTALLNLVFKGWRRSSLCFRSRISIVLRCSLSWLPAEYRGSVTTLLSDWLTLQYIPAPCKLQETWDGFLFALEESHTVQGQLRIPVTRCYKGNIMQISRVSLWSSFLSKKIPFTSTTLKFKLCFLSSVRLPASA